MQRVKPEVQSPLQHGWSTPPQVPLPQEPFEQVVVPQRVPLARQIPSTQQPPPSQPPIAQQGPFA